jgi:hypothetical protein
MSNVIFQPPPGLAWSVTKRPKYSTLVQTPISARGQLRIARQQYPIWEYEMVWEYLKGGEQTGITTSSRADNAYQQLLGFFMARQGGYDSFLYSDPNDNFVSMEQFGVGDGSTTAFQLQRMIGSGVDIVQDVDSSVSAPSIYKYDFQGIKNICLWSESISTSPWGLFAGNPVATPNAAFAPDGSLTATSIYFSTGSQQSWLQFVQIPSGTATGRTFTFSIWMRSDVTCTTQMEIGDNTTNNSQSTITVTPTWQRFQLSCSYGATSSTIQYALFGNRNGTQPAAKIYVWGAQVEEGASATAYVKTLNTFWGPTPLYPFTRGNYLTWSQAFDNASWNKTQLLAVTADTIVAPDGTTTAEALTPSGGATDSATGVAVSGGVSTFNNSTVTFSVWLKVPSGTKTINIYIVDNFAAIPVSVTITSAWKRFSVTTALPGALTTLTVQIGGGATWTTGTIHAWGAQFEFGNGGINNIATSYIPTTSVAPIFVTDYSVGSTGIVAFASAPASGAFLSWTGSYYYRLRFLDDSVDFEEFMYQFWQCRSVRFESVIL